LDDVSDSHPVSPTGKKLFPLLRRHSGIEPLSSVGCGAAFERGIDAKQFLGAETVLFDAGAEIGGDYEKAFGHSTGRHEKRTSR
jgi:hypothetical protein